MVVWKIPLNKVLTIKKAEFSYNRVSTEPFLCKKNLVTV